MGIFNLKGMFIMLFNIKRLFSLILSFTLCMSLCSCVGSQGNKEAAEDDAKNTSDPSKENKNPNILFIGNSATYYNDMPTVLFYNIMKDAGYDATVLSLVKGGQYLIDSANPDDELGAQVVKTLKEEKFDYVILQDNTLCPINEPEKFDVGIRSLVKMVRENGATPILYNTVARGIGHPELETNGLTNKSMTDKVAKAYKDIGEELNVDVAHVGPAFYEIHNGPEYIDVYDDDNAHPSKAGSYLAALTIYAEMTGNDPTKLTYDAEFDEDVAYTLKKTAKDVVFNTPKISD